MKKILATAACLLLLAGIVVAAGVWLARDLPRRRAQAALADALGADVRVGSLTIAGLRRYVLRGIVVRRMVSQPRLESLRMETLEVTGDLREINASRFESLRLAGVEIRLATPPPGQPPPAASSAPTLVVGHLDLERCRIVFVAAGLQRPQTPEDTRGSVAPSSDAVVEAEGSINGIGGDLEGEIRLSSPALELAPLAAVALGSADALVASGLGGTIDGFQSSLRITEYGRFIAAETSCRTLIVRRGGRELALPGTSLSATLRESRGPAPEWRLEGHTSLPIVESAVVSATFNRSWAITSADARVRGLDLQPIAGLAAGSSQVSAEISGKADADAKLADGGAIEYHLAATLPRVAIESRDSSLLAEGLTVEGKGSNRLGSGGPLGVQLGIDRASGHAGSYVLPASLFPVRMSFEGSLALAGGALLEGEAIVQTATAGTLRLDGALPIAALSSSSSNGGEAALRWSWKGDLASIASTAGEAGIALPASVILSGAAAAEGTIRGRLDSPLIEARGDLTKMEARPAARDAAQSWTLRAGHVTAEASWRPPRGSIEIRSLELRAEAAVSPLPPIPLSLSAAGRIDPATTNASIDRLEMRSPGLADITAHGTASAAEGSAAERFTIEGRAAAMDLERWRAFLRPVLGDSAAGYSVKGSAEAAFRAALGPEGLWKASGTATVSGNGFASKDGSRVLEGLQSSWRLGLEADPARSRIALSGTGDLSGFQLLWGSVFADASRLGSTLDVSLEAAGRRWTGRGTWTAPGGPRIVVSFEDAPGSPLSWTVSANVDRLDTAIEKYLRGPLGDSIPFLQKINAGGSLDAAAAGRLGPGDAASVTGRVRLAGLSIAGAEAFAQVEGLGLDLPFDLTWSPPGPDGHRTVSGPALKGSLRFQRISAGGMTVPGVETGLTVQGDSIEIEQSLSVKVLGGQLGLEKLVLADLTRTERRAESRLLLKRVSMHEATAAFGLPVLEGEASGSFPKVRLTADAFEVEGGGSVSIFGGTIDVADISGEDILSRYPKIMLSAVFENIDLGEVTRTFDFGEMTGIVHGFLNDLVLFRGAPVSFEGQIQTADRPGTPRTINVKAINNLAIIGTGGNLSVFDRGIHRFFKKYTYDWLHVWMKLQDDQFLLSGREHRGRELFLKGRLPLPIDVVNVQPGTTISFSAMLERLREVDFTAPTRGKVPAGAGM